MTTTLWRGARLATLADRHGWGLVERGALLTDDERSRWVGAEADLPPSLDADAEHDLERRARHARAWSTATPTWSTAASARASSSSACKARATRRSRAPAAASARPSRRRARPSDEALFDGAPASARCALMAEGVTTLEIKSGYGLSREHEARCLRVARRLGRELPLTVQTTCLAAHALPPEFDGRADDYIDAVCALAAGAARRRPGRCGRRLLRAHRLHAGADAARLRRRARARPAGQAARRAAQRSGRRRARRRVRRAVVRPPRIPVGTTACARWPRPARVAVLLPGAFYFLRETKLPPVAGAARRRRADRDRERPQPGLVAGAVAAADAEHGLHAVPPDARGGAARRHRARRARARPRRPRHAAPPASAPTSWSGTLDHPNELAYWFGHNPCRRVVAGGVRSSSVMSDADLHAAPRHDAAARQPAARRHRDPRRRRCRAGAARAALEDTDWHLDRLYAFARDARREPARAALRALRRSTSTARPRTRRCTPA